MEVESMAVTVGGKHVVFCKVCHGSGVVQNVLVGNCVNCGGRGYFFDGTENIPAPNLEINLKVVNDQLLDVLQQRDELKEQIGRLENIIIGLERQLKENVDVYNDVKRERDGLFKIVVSFGLSLPTEKKR
jgi:hypothetical protein